MNIKLFGNENILDTALNLYNRESEIAVINVKSVKTERENGDFIEVHLCGFILVC